MAQGRIVIDTGTGEGASQLLLDVVDKPFDATFVVMEEVALENWSWGGLAVAEYRKKRANAARSI